MTNNISVWCAFNMYIFEFNMSEWKSVVLRVALLERDASVGETSECCSHSEFTL